MATGAVFDDGCTIDETLPRITSLKLSITNSSYVPGRSMTGRFPICVYIYVGPIVIMQYIKYVQS